MDLDVSLDTSGVQPSTFDTDIASDIVECFENYLKELRMDEANKPKELVILEEIMKEEIQTEFANVLKALSCLLIFWLNRIQPRMAHEDFAVFAANALRLTIRIENDMEMEETCRTLAAIFKEIGKDESVILSSTNNLLFVLFFAFLYPTNTDSSKVLKAVKDTTNTKSESEFLVKLICYCTDNKDALSTVNVNGKAQVAKRLIENFLKSYDCSTLILSQFFADMLYFSTFPVGVNAPTSTIEFYSHSLLEFIKEKVKNKNYGSLQDEQRLLERTLPLLISQRYTAKDFLDLIEINSSWDQFEKNLISIICEEKPPTGVTQIGKHAQRQVSQQMQQAGQQLQQQQLDEEKCMQWLKKHTQQHTEKMTTYKHVLGRISKTIYSTSIEVKGNPVEEAVLMSAFVKNFVEEIEDGKGNKAKPIVCLVLENADDFDNLPAWKVPTSYVFSKFDGLNNEVFKSDCIIYCSRADSKLIPRNDDKGIFGVISWVEPVNEIVDRLTTLSPTMVLVYIFVQLFLKIKKLDRKKIIDTQEVKAELLKYMQKKEKNCRIFNEHFLDKAIKNYLNCDENVNEFHWEAQWIKNEASASRKDEKREKEILKDVKSRFKAGWICLTDILPNSNEQPQTKIKEAYGQAKEHVPFLMKNETTWLNAIEDEVKQSIKNGKAVIVTTKSLFHKKVENQFKNKIAISTGTHLTAKNVFLFDISERMIISSDADIHVVSTCFPSDECQYSRLAGVTVCEKNQFTQRFVVNKEHLPADLAECFCYWQLLKDEPMGATDATIADATPFDPLSKTRSERSFKNIFRFQFNQWKQCCGQRNVCLAFLREAIRKMNDRNIKTVEDFSDAIFNHQKTFMIKLQENLNFTSPIDERSELYGRKLAGQDLNAAFKHFCEFIKIGDLTDQARNVKAIRRGKHSDGKETILFLKKGEDPENFPVIEKNGGIPRHKIFKDHLACDVEYKGGEVIGIKMLTGDFAILVKDDDSLFHFERKYCKTHEENTITIYSQLKEGKNILELLKEQYGKSSTVRNLLRKYEVLLDENKSESYWSYCALM